MLTEDHLRITAIIKFMDNVISLHHHYEDGHEKRCEALVEKIALEMELPITDIVLLRYASRLHDIGKIGISEHILSRRHLAKSEMDMIKGHPVRGAALLDGMGFDEKISLAIRHHHENFDSSGYPDGLAGEQIPLWSRIILIADTYDGITGERVYHAPRTITETLKIMEGEAGKSRARRFLEYSKGLFPMNDELIMKIVTIVTGGNVLIFIGSLITLYVNRKESKARTDNFDVSADKIRNDILEQIKRQLVEQNKDLILQVEKLQNEKNEAERNYKDKLRIELDRFHKEFEAESALTRRDLQLAREEKIILIKQIDILTKENSILKNESTDRQIRIEGLEALVQHLAQQHEKTSKDLDTIKRTTGNLGKK